MFLIEFKLGEFSGNPAATDGFLFKAQSRQFKQGYKYQPFKVAMKIPSKFSPVTHEIFIFPIKELFHSFM